MGTVVIGGGVIGCSILYHLTKLGWRDVILLEWDEQTLGSTWQATTGINGLHDSTNISRIHHYTRNLYKELEVDTTRAVACCNQATSIWRRHLSGKINCA